jgi:hypothetical protein
MRSFDRYKQRYQKNAQSGDKKEDKVEEWDFKSNFKHKFVKHPIFLSQSNFMSKKDHFERFIRQLSMAIYACSLCGRGKLLFEVGNTIRDPQYPPSPELKEIAIIKYEPNELDENNFMPGFDDFYKTSINKCPNHVDCKCKCPFFDLEYEAMSECYPKFWIITDKLSADYLGLEWDVGNINKSFNFRYFCADFGSKEMSNILKIISNPETRKRLLTF